MKLFWNKSPKIEIVMNNIELSMEKLEFLWKIMKFSIGNYYGMILNENCDSYIIEWRKKMYGIKKMYGKRYVIGVLQYIKETDKIF